MNTGRDAPKLPTVEELATILAGGVGGLAEAPKVTLSALGGMPSERYEFDLVVDPAGSAVVRLMDELKGQRVEEHRLELALGETLELLAGLDPQELLAAAQAELQIPPDSVVGELTLEIAGTRVGVRFMADEGQAETEGAKLPPTVAALVERLFDLGKRVTGLERIRP